MYIGQYTGTGEVAVSLEPRRRRAGKQRAEKGCKADRVLAAGTSLGGEGEGLAALTPWGWGAGPADRSPSPPVAGGLGVAAPGAEVKATWVSLIAETLGIEVDPAYAAASSGAADAEAEAAAAEEAAAEEAAAAAAAAAAEAEARERAEQVVSK